MDSIKDEKSPPVPTLGSSGISFEAIGVYNITMFFLGSISFIFNSMECYINIKNKLYNQSLYNCLRLYSNCGGAILGGRHILMSLINFSPIGNHPLMFSKEVCKYRGIFDMIVVHVFQISYCLECFIFSISILFPLFYMIWLDRVLVKKIIAIYIVVSSTIPGLLLLTKDPSIPKALPRCIVYEIWTRAFHFYHSIFTTVMTLTLLIIFILTTISMNKLTKKRDEEAKRNVCSFIRWTLAFFILFWSAPNFFMVISKLFDLQKEIRKTYLDLFYISVTISQIIPFPFAIWKNKIIKKHFFELNFVKKFTTQKNLTKVKVIKI